MGVIRECGVGYKIGPLFADDAELADRLFAALPVPLGVRTALSTKSGSCDVLVAEVDAGAGRRAIYLIPLTQDPEAETNPLLPAMPDMPVPIILVAPSGQVTAFNRMAEKIEESERRNVAAGT